MTGSGPVVRKKTYELVADRLTAEIGERRLRPGNALPTERQLTQEYRVGRSSVREALRMLNEDLGRMLTALQEMHDGLDSEERYIDADVRFHLAIAAATKNRCALHMMQALRKLFHRALSSVYHIPGSPQTSLAQHRLILDAIAAGRPQEARRRMQEHLTRVEGDIERTFADGPEHRYPPLAEALGV